MNKIQYNQAVELIDRDCHVRRYYLDDYEEKQEGKTCAIGCFALAAGVTVKYLREHISDTIECEYCDHMARKIKAKFGLTVGQQIKVQRINDAVVDLALRRRRIKKYLRSLLK